MGKHALALAVSFSACVAARQAHAEEQLDRVLRLVHTKADWEILQLAATIRSLADFRQSAADPPQGTLALRGTASQIALAEWLVSELDRPANGRALAELRRDPAAHKYRLSASDDVVRVFYLARAETSQDVNEVAAMARVVTEIRRMVTYAPLKAVAVRGTADEIEFATWLFQELDAGPRPSSTSHEYRLRGRGNDVARVFFLANTETPQNLNDLVSVVRALGDIRSVSTWHSSRTLAMRGTADQIALAAWLLKELDQPAPPQEAARQRPDPAAYEYYPREGGQDFVRMFFFAPTQTVENLNATAARLRSTTGIRRLVSYGALRAVALRGTANQVARAEQLIQELKR